MSDDTQQLLSAARRGDLSAQAKLMQTYESYLNLLARLQIHQVMQGRVSASDVVQEVFLRAHQGFAKFRGNSEQELVAWLRSILASQLVAFARHHLAQRRDARLDLSYDAAIEASSAALGECFAAHVESPSRCTVRREEAVLLSQALDQLPADYREVIVLRHLQGVSFADIATQMSRTIPSIKGTWMRAVTRLRSLLNQETLP